MTGTTSASGNTKSAIVDAAAGVLREAGAGAPDGTTPVAALGPALLGAWPEDSGGPEVAARAMVDLITGSDPAAKGLVRGLLAAAPAPLTQLARISRLTSLERALAGRAGDLEPAACRRRLDELVPATEGDDGARLTALQEKVTGWTADLVAGRQLNEADTAGLAGLVRLEATARLARAEGVAGNLDGQDGAAPGRRRLLARWTEASHDLDRLAAGLVGGDLEDPRAVRSRLAVAIGPEAMAALVAGAASWSGGQRLARLLKQLAQPELRVEDPAAAFDRMLAVVAAQGDGSFFKTGRADDFHQSPGRRRAPYLFWKHQVVTFLGQRDEIQAIGRGRGVNTQTGGRLPLLHRAGHCQVGALLSLIT